jgi:hypothetical protein
VVKGEDSQLSGCGFESRRRILDGVSEASYYIEKGNKGSQTGHTKKKIKKNKKKKKKKKNKGPMLFNRHGQSAAREPHAALQTFFVALEL